MVICNRRRMNALLNLVALLFTRVSVVNVDNDGSRGLNSELSFDQFASGNRRIYTHTYNTQKKSTKMCVVCLTQTLSLRKVTRNLTTQWFIDKTKEGKNERAANDFIII